MASIDYFARDFGDDNTKVTQSSPKVDYFSRDFGDDDTESAVNKKSTGEKLGAGVEQGIRDAYSTLDPAAKWIEKKIRKVTLGGVLPTAEDVSTQNNAARNKFEQQYGDSTAANIGRVGGNILATLPVLGAGGKIVGYAGKALSEAAPATEGLINFLSGSTKGNILKQLASKGASGAIQGAAGNALISGGSDAPIEDQLKQGAAIGSILGPAGALVVKGAKGIGNAAGNLFRSPEDNAARKILQAVTRDQIPISEVENRLGNMGDEASMIDTGGKNMLRLADTAANVPGPGQEKIAQFLNERQAGQQERLMNATASGLNINPEVNYEGAIDDLISQRAENAKPLYEKAFEKAPVTSDRINEFLADPIMKGGLKRGMEIQRLESLAEGKPFNPTDYGITGFNDAGDPIIGSVPNMRLLDAAKKGVDAIISDNTDKFGKVNEFGRAVTKVKNSYVKELDNINPDYATARASFSEPSQSLGAIDKGKNFIKNGSYGNAKELAKMSDQDKQFFRIGVGKAISDMIDGTKEGSDAADKIFSTPKLQKALESVFPTKEAFNDFSKTVKNEMKFFANRRAILGGSPTAPRLASAADAAQEAPIGLGDLANAAKGNFGKAALSVGSKLKNSLTQISPEKANAIADMLLSPDRAATLNKLGILATPRVVSGLENFIGNNYIPVTSLGTNRLLESTRSTPR